MGITGIVRDNRYIDHRPGDYHPESPRRLEVIYAMLDEPEMSGHFSEIAVRKATKGELLRIHSSDYIDAVAETEGKPYVSLDADTTTSSGSYNAALLAAGGLCQAIDKVILGELRNALALVRPPGHHAERNRGMGFCLFNNVAVAARYAQDAHGLKRILIVDWDLHHGNGTQHSFEADPSILYFSTHQYPHYPGTGAFHETGKDLGTGFTVNVPLSSGYGDGEYVAIFENILKPIARQFEPELILVSTGFDIYQDDPLGGMLVTPSGFACLTRSIMDMADACCEGRAVFTLEGGYNLTGLRDSVKAVLKELSGMSKSDCGNMTSRADHQNLDYILKQVRTFHGKFWRKL
ncbi:MAG: histone deacetylase [Desulfatiglans sp.]|jgi:acetoin utilization deacetylase AcuC-like enzyme|nr:histone deacetylase [Thermodesulfobacteriota bacterium]MEE4354121.1 histone deacetylase [Desulfatiglans sp.]